MGWCTAGTNKKPWHSRQSFKHGWQNAAWKCIRRKPGSLTARTGTAKASIRIYDSTSSDMAFGPGWFDAPETTRCSGASTRRSRFGAEGHAAAIRELNLRHRTDLPMDEIARQINPLLRGWIEYYGRYSPSALYPLLDTYAGRSGADVQQPYPGLDRLLWPFLQVGALSRPAPHRPHLGTMGASEVKSLRRHKRRTHHWLAHVVRRQPDLFAHWSLLHGRGRTMGAG